MFHNCLNLRAQKTKVSKFVGVSQNLKISYTTLSTLTNFPKSSDLAIKLKAKAKAKKKKILPQRKQTMLRKKT